MGAEWICGQELMNSLIDKFQSCDRYPIALNQTILIDGVLIDVPYWDKLSHSVKTDRMSTGNVSLFCLFHILSNI